MHRDWPVKKTIVDLPIRMKGNSKRISGNTLSPLGAQNRDMGAASQMFMYHEEQLTKNRVLYYENFSVVVMFIILIIKYSFFSFLLNELIQGSIKETMMYRFPQVTGNPSW